MLRRLLIALVLLGISAQAHASSNGILTQGLSSSTSSPGGSTSLSALTSATGTNTFDNAAFPQIWTWNSLSTQTALNLLSSSATTGSLLSLTNSGSGNALTVNGKVGGTFVAGVANGGTGSSTAFPGLDNLFGATSTASNPQYFARTTTGVTGVGLANIYAAHNYMSITLILL